MRLIILLWMLTMPCIAFAATDCRVIEYRDHFEAICNGDETTKADAQQSVTEPVQPAAQSPADPAYGPRPGRMSRSRMAAAIQARDKLLLQLSQGGELKGEP